MNRVEQHLRHWLAHRNALLGLIDVLPAVQVQFKPWEGAMPLGQLPVHIAGSAYGFVNFVKSGEFNRPAPPEWKSLEDVKSIVKNLTERTQAVYASLTDAELDAVREIPHMGMKGPGALFLGAAIDHEVHHKGQLFVYARMTGVEKVPFFIARPDA